MRISDWSSDVCSSDLFVHWKDQEGGTWEGRLFYPVGYRQNRRYPLVIQTHVWGRRVDFTLYGRGSISPTLGPGRSVYLAQPLANTGLAVLPLGPPPPGSSTPPSAEPQSRVPGVGRAGVA